MDEFKDFENFNPEPQEKTSSLNKGLLLFSLLTIPFYLRFIFYNVVYDFPLGWLIFGVITLIIIVAFSKSTESGWQLTFYGYKGIYSKYLVIFILPIIITSFVEDLKLSQSAIIHNENYVRAIPQTISRDEEESIDLLYRSLSVVNTIGGQMVYFAQMPFLGFFNKIEVVKIYQGCLIKKLEGDYSDKNKQQAYSRYYQDYWNKTTNHRFSGVGQIIQQSYMNRLSQNLAQILTKVFLLYPFDRC